jgi:hypothetical protein
MKKRHAHSRVTSRNENLPETRIADDRRLHHPGTVQGALNLVDRIRQVEPLLNRANIDRGRDTRRPLQLYDAHA